MTWLTLNGMRDLEIITSCVMHNVSHNTFATCGASRTSWL
jgi:hypothetical protein